ncbi:MAG: glutaredoxin domain-containing protein [Frankiaceae bacterium]
MEPRLAAPNPDPIAARIVVVSSPGCHFCADAAAALTEIAADYPLSVSHLDAESAQGAALVRTAGAPMYPLVLVDGQVFSWGRLPRRKLRRLLTQRAARLQAQTELAEAR